MKTPIFRTLVLGIVTLGLIETSLARADDKIQPKISLKAMPFEARDVRLLDGPFLHAMELDGKFLLSLEPDRLLECVPPGGRTEAEG